MLCSSRFYKSTSFDELAIDEPTPVEEDEPDPSPPDNLGK
jgi:hypothetical protein